MQSSTTVLPNGLRLVMSPMPEMRSVSVVVFVAVGSRYETEREAGLAHLIEHMLFKGTSRRPNAQRISETIDAVGGAMNASTDKELTVYWAKTAREHLPLACDLLGDMLLCSVLRPSDVARERMIIVEELSSLVDDPQEWVHVLLDEIVYPGHPLGREIAGSRGSVESLTRRDVLRFSKSHYGPNNAVVSVAGGIDLEETSRLVQEHFGAWQPVRAPQPSPAPGENALSSSPASTSERRPIEQVNIALAFPGVPRGHADRWTLDLLCTILGGGASSRLFASLRERLGLVYDVQMYSVRYSDTGTVNVSAGTDAARVDQALEAVEREIERVQRRRVPDAELQRAKQFYRGRLSLGLEDTHAVASWFGSQEMLQHSAMTPEEAADAIDAVSASDLLRVARQYLRSDERRLALVGPVPSSGAPAVLATG